MTRRDLPPAIVMGGNANAVSVTRSLGRAGVEVFALGNQADQVRHSRFCRGFVDVGRGAGIGDRWLEWLLANRRGAVLLPCDDDALELIANHRGLLERAGYLPVEANDDVLLAMLDKEATYELARRAGVPAPRTIRLIWSDDVDRAAEILGFPFALKPAHSHRFARHFSGRKLFVVRDHDELRARAAETRALRLEMIATEIIPGPDHNLCSYYSYLDDAGRALFHFTKRKIRQYPRNFGLGSMEISDRASDVAELGARLYREIRLRGLAAAEFKRDARDGTLKLIEVNHRFTGSNEIVQASGIDLARLVYARLAGLPLPPVEPYRSGVTLWNPARDLRSLAIGWREGDTPIDGWLGGLLRRHALPVFSWDDPMPTVARHIGMIGRVHPRRRSPAAMAVSL